MSTIQDRLKNLQTRIGVEPDGILGPVTMTRLEELVSIALPDAVEPLELSLIVSKVGLDEIVRFEISSEANYRRNLQSPIWPGAESGVTVGIGYDLGYVTAARIESDWRGKILDVDLGRLLKTAGLKGLDAKKALSKVKDVVVPLKPAQEVFFKSTLPHYAALTKRTYPGVEELPADAQAMLLSLIFNRGTSITGPTRIEMKEIKALVPAQDLAGIAEQVRAMKRLWDPATLRGLHIRRDREAEIIAAARRHYDDAELVRI